MNTIGSAWCNLDPIRANVANNHVPKQAGLYKLTFKLWGTIYVYIGQARNLWERIDEYARNPKRWAYMEHLMLDLLNEAGEAELSVCCVGLESEKDRCGFETTATTELRRQGQKCLNRRGLTDDRMKRFRLKSEERMLIKDLARVRAKLATLGEDSDSRGVQNSSEG